MLTVCHVAARLRELGVTHGGVLLVHTSFKAVGPIESGPLGLIHALRDAIGEDGTLVMPTMTDGETPFDPASTPTSGMGIVAETFWRQPGVLRSTHPGGSFAALGPLASRICAPQPLSPPHGPDSPPGRVHDLGGQVLLLGVTHSENTTLHVAEAIAQVPYSVEHPCVVEIDGDVRTVMIAETDHCCRRFAMMDDWLRERGLQREGRVGNAHARLCASRDIVAVAVEKLREDPLLFLCPVSEECAECAAARASVERRRPGG
ncbi:MAG: AAC(3) family N-acetyltransferase [Thermoanaerobaculia bacterium]